MVGCRPYRWLSVFWALALVCGTNYFGFAGLTARANPPLSDLGALERRFFSRQYPHDPPEKRFERLELLVFGTPQAGTLDERLSRLQRVLARKEEHRTVKSKLQPAPLGASGSLSSRLGQYPVLNTLEWRVLKKSYPHEALGTRLDRLETRLFGQPASAIPYADRVERLKKTVGIDIARGPYFGPMPKAKPQLPRAPYYNSPFEENRESPFGSVGPMWPDGVADMMETMERQMEDMMRLPPGQYQIAPDNHEYPRSPHPGHGRRSLPPYYDPSTI